MKYFVLTLLVGLSVVACNKEDQNDPSGVGPSAITITLDTPAENEDYDFGEQIQITGSIVSTNVIHGYTVTLKNSSNQDSVLFLEEVHSHDSQIDFSESWTNNLTDTSTVMVEIIALGNHEGTVSDTLVREIVCNGQ